MSDLLLWKQLKSGDKKALERIYLQEINFLLAYGKKLSKDEHLAADCVQDLFVELWRNRAGLGNTDSIRRYLLVSLRRKIIRNLQKSQKVQANTTPEDAHFAAELAIDTQLIAAEISAEQAIQLKKAFAELSNRQQEAIYLKYYTGMDYKEIAEVMDINYQSVRNLIFNALNVLRNLLGLLIFAFRFIFLDKF
ncbi:MAG: sigma-70 family RNA polymerase sigma factor [Saprospiraceae bacterium]